MGLIGGGQGAFIGRVHATAAVLDNRAALVAGALSSDAAKAKASAADYDIPAERAYGSYKEMADAEGKRADKVDFVSVATPNHTHFEIAKTFVEAGFNVICDKPLTLDLAQAEELLKVVEKSGVVFAVTHNYTGYPLVRQAREMVLNGELGEINAIRSNYIQGWLRTRLEASDQKQAKWRTDPKQSGIAGCFGAHRHARVQPRPVHHRASAEGTLLLAEDLRGGPGARRLRRRAGAVRQRRARDRHRERRSRTAVRTTCSSRWTGRRARSSGTRRSRTSCWVRKNGEPHKLYTRNGGPYLGVAARARASGCRAGHPEAFFEAFANVYGTAYDAMVKRREQARSSRR